MLRRPPLALLGALLALAIAPALAPAQSTAPSRGAQVFAGQQDRFTMDGTWLRRLDPGDVGLAQRWQEQASGSGWSRTRVPDVWNARDQSDASAVGGVGWYRRTFALPRGFDGGRWILRFENVSVQATVWVNGRRIGEHRGTYDPFELQIPGGVLKRTKPNRLVVRVDSRRTPQDLPPLDVQPDGRVGGGWWNDSGITREVTLRRADRLDLAPVQVTPDLESTKGDGLLDVRATVTNTGPRARGARVVVRVGDRAKVVGRPRVPARGSREVRTRMRIPRPRVWSPGRPQLTTVKVEASVEGGEVVSTYRVRTGFRRVRVTGGQLEINQRRVNLRGVGLHESDARTGAALSRGQQNTLLRQVQDMGARVMRAHYPLHPRILEEADRRGLLVWSEVPVYQVTPSNMNQGDTRERAVGLLSRMIVNNAHHPSVFTWSAGNEMATRPSASIGRYFRDARTAKDGLDRTRPLSYAHAAALSQVCRTDYSAFELEGINDYFGWYGSGNSPLRDPANLGPYLDRTRACAPSRAFMITEFGAEATIRGGEDQRGSFAFQEKFVRHHLAVYRNRPWLSGQLYWALRDFRVRPGWNGGNPFPDAPWFHKGAITRDGGRKGVWTVLRGNFAATDQLAPAPTGPFPIPPSPPGPDAAPVDPGGGGDAADDAGAATPGARSGRSRSGGAAAGVPSWQRDQGPSAAE